MSYCEDCSRLERALIKMQDARAAEKARANKAEAEVERLTKERDEAREENKRLHANIRERAASAEMGASAPLCPSCGHAEHGSQWCGFYASTVGICNCHGCFRSSPPLPAKQPFRCPVCLGSGTVPLSGASYSTQEYPCHACGGKGIVWEP